MATKIQIRAEDYLRMTFEHDAEFVHGEIVERSMPDYVHGRVQFFLSMLFGRVSQLHRLYPCVEVRMKVAPDTYRIPDVAVFAKTPPQQSVPETPPLVVLEILSEDDRHVDVVQKVDEYRAWGVPNIWLIDPIGKRLAVCTEWGMRYVSSLSLPEYSFQLNPAELFENL